MRAGLERWTAPTVLALVAAVVIIDSLAYPPSLVPGAPGPAFFPRLLAAGLLACAGVLGRRAARGTPRPDGEPAGGATAADADGRGTGSRLHRLDRPRVAGGIVAVAGFLLLGPRTDTIATLPLLVTSLMALMGERRVAPLVAVPLGFTLFVYLVFERAFGVPLPTSLF